MIIPNMPHDEYLKLEHISNSGLGLVEHSPAHFKAGFKGSTASMELGSLVHLLVLQPELFEATYEVAQIDRRTKEGKEKAKEIELSGKTPLTPALYEQASCMMQSVAQHPIASYLFSEGTPELTIIDEIDGVTCKARLDWLRPDGVIVDLKTTQDASSAAFKRSVHSYGYHRQDAFYSDLYALQPNATRNDFIFVGVESSPPYAVAIHTLDESFKEVGRLRYQKALSLYKSCLELDYWPGYPNEISVLSPAPWMIEAA